MRPRRFLVAASVVAFAAGCCALGQTASASSPTPRHAGRWERGLDSGLHAQTGASDPSSPYDITTYGCGFSDAIDVSGRSVLVGYGGDGGDTPTATGGSSSAFVAAESFAPGSQTFVDTVGCAGTSTDASATAGGGGDGNAGAGGDGVAGSAGAGGGGATAVVTDRADGSTELAVAAGGGGAGAGASAADGGNGDNDAQTTRGGHTVVGTSGVADGGLPDGAAGTPTAGGAGASGTAGGGGGGDGIVGGGGGASGLGAALPSGGGGGGSSELLYSTGFGASIPGAGDGQHADGSVSVVTVKPTNRGPYWPGWNIARGVAALHAASGGYVVDGYGGMHAYGQGSDPLPPRVTGGASWPRDLARGIALLPDDTGGFVLDAYGGLHGFATGGGAAPRASNGPKWSGHDFARGVALLPDGTGGYVLDLYGGLHPFGVNGHNAPAPVAFPLPWPGADLARGVSVPFEDTAGNPGGWISDAYGGLHAWGSQLGALPEPAVGAPYWKGFPIARGISSMVAGFGGVELDGYGGLHSFVTAGNP